MSGRGIVPAALILAAVCAALDGCNTGTQSQKKETQVTDKATKNPVVVMKTSKGTMTIELYADKAPATVENFLGYVDGKFYDGTIFHRVIPGFMVQGGGFTPDMNQKATHEPVRNEAASGLKNTRGTLAMARTSDVNSATAQFFINVVDNAFLDHRGKTPQGYGYCVFGKVTDRMDVADAIVSVPTANRGPYENVPTTPVVIESVRRAEP